VTVIAALTWCCVPNFIEIGSRIRPPDAHNCSMFNAPLVGSGRCHGNQIVGDMSGTWWDVPTQVAFQSQLGKLHGFPGLFCLPREWKGEVEKRRREIENGNQGGLFHCVYCGGSPWTNSMNCFTLIGLQITGECLESLWLQVYFSVAVTRWSLSP